MLNIRKITENAQDKERMLEMVKDFYHSPAVDHWVADEVLERTVFDAAAGNGIEGYLLYDGERIAGYSLVTCFYAAEIGGKCVMIEDLYLKDDCRGKGFGRQFFAWIQEHYKDARRFRLEVTMENKGAIALYQRLGFGWLHYGQMVLERP